MSDDTAKIKAEWLHQHIPHRVLASLALCHGLMTERLGKRAEVVAAKQVTLIRAQVYAMHEGRHAAVRWLIEFIGIRQNRKGQAVRVTKIDPADWNITDLGGTPFPIPSEEADFLANIWRGCTQATGHSTRDTNHFNIETPNLEKAMRLILAHLERELYRPANVDLGI